jgi:hypothetical protein
MQQVFSGIFKKYTTKKMIENIKEFEPEVSGLFKKGESGCCFRKQDNQSELIENESSAIKKMNYIQ